MSEAELIQALRERNESAFRQLVDSYKNSIYNASLGIVQNTDEAEDIAQEVFIEVIHSIHHFKGESKLSTWIYRIAVTKSLEQIRKKKRQKRFGFMIRLFQGDANSSSIDVPDFVHPGVLMENRERAAILFKAIDSLTENQKVAFTLNKIDDMSYEEIASVMNVSLSSVESLIHRAKVNLQKKLESLIK
ncbi:MAG: RNA polymerase sigma factor [Cyclobacteriaceae bacterium]|nr:RNA polymerase sigma factor [Cyclobacteriaceae bacterium]